MNEIKHGARPIPLDKEDNSYHKTFRTYGTVDALPEEVDLDLGLWMPDQNAPEPIFGNPAQPEGCTNYATNDLCANEDGQLYNPAYTESITHANANGGGDIRVSLQTTVDYGVLAKGETTDFEAAKHKRPALFRVGQNPDYFDGMRVVIAHRRCVSTGSPWFPEWSSGSSVTLNDDGSISYGILATPKPPILPTPDLAFYAKHQDTYNRLPWHDYAYVGYTKHDTKGNLIRNGDVFLKVKSWQGDKVGDVGFFYQDRATVNAVFTLFGTGGFTVAAPSGPLQKVGSSYIFLKSLGYGMTGPEVANLQMALQSLGYTILHAVTIHFLDETKTALARFQKDHGIVDDGSHFGPLTRAVMNAILNPAQSRVGAILEAFQLAIIKLYSSV